MIAVATFVCFNYETEKRSLKKLFFILWKDYVSEIVRFQSAVSIIASFFDFQYSTFLPKIEVQTLTIGLLTT